MLATAAQHICWQMFSYKIMENILQSNRISAVFSVTDDKSETVGRVVRCEVFDILNRFSAPVSRLGASCVVVMMLPSYHIVYYFIIR